MYVEGSKSDKGVSAAVVCQDTIILLRLPYVFSVYSAEA